MMLPFPILNFVNYAECPSISRFISINAKPGFLPSFGGSFGFGGGFLSGTTIFGVFLSSFGGGFLGWSLLCAEAVNARPTRSAAVNNICFNTLITFFFPLSFLLHAQGKDEKCVRLIFSNPNAKDVD